MSLDTLKLKIEKQNQIGEQEKKRIQELRVLINSLVDVLKKCKDEDYLEYHLDEFIAEGVDGTGKIFSRIPSVARKSSTICLECKTYVIHFEIRQGNRSDVDYWIGTKSSTRDVVHG